MTEVRAWIVTTSRDRPIREIAKDLQDAGFDVGHVLEEVGCITGTAGDDVMATVRSVEGVVRVSPDLPVGVAPPASPDNW